jgi:Helicase conserved C-terminal domain
MTVVELAAFADSDDGLRALVDGLDDDARRVLLSIAWAGGSAQHGVAVPAGNDGPSDGRLDIAIEQLQQSLLIAPASPLQPWVSVAADVMRIVSLPGIAAVNGGLADILSDELAATLRNAGASDIPSRRDEREAMLVKLLRDPTHVHRLVESLSLPAQAILNGLVDRIEPSPEYVSSGTFGRSLDRRYGRGPSTRYGAPMGARIASVPAGPVSPMAELYDVGLIGFSQAEHCVWAWREVVQILRPSLVPRWDSPPAPTTAKASVSDSLMAYPLSMIGRLLDSCRAEPPEALADGGIGVGVVRKLAKQLKVNPGHLGLMIHLAIDLKLLRRDVVGTEGRGRNARHLMKWKVTDTAGSWSNTPPLERWQELVMNWMKDRRFNDTAGLPERWAPGYVDVDPLPRQLVIRELEAIAVHAPGSGVIREDFAAWMVWRRPRLVSPGAVRATIDALCALGLAAIDGPLALTVSARLLLNDELADAEPVDQTVSTGKLVVQADYTIIAFPEAAVEARLFVDRVAALESEAGARVYRLTEVSLRAAMDGGLSATEIDSQLRLHASTAVPQSVSYLIADVARKRETAVVASAATVIASSDPAVIAAAVRVKAAGLRAIGPYTAVSQVAAEKVRATLASKGIHVTPEVVTEDPVVVARREANEKAQAKSREESLALMRQFMATQTPPLVFIHDELDDPEFSDDGDFDAGSLNGSDGGSVYVGARQFADVAQRLFGDAKTGRKKK